MTRIIVCSTLSFIAGLAVTSAGAQDPGQVTPLLLDPLTPSFMEPACPVCPVCPPPPAPAPSPAILQKAIDAIEAVEAVEAAEKAAGKK